MAEWILDRMGRKQKQRYSKVMYLRLESYVLCGLGQEPMADEIAPHHAQAMRVEGQPDFVVAAPKHRPGGLDRDRVGRQAEQVARAGTGPRGPARPLRPTASV